MELNEPVLLHVNTTKGKVYEPADKKPAAKKKDPENKEYPDILKSTLQKSKRPVPSSRAFVFDTGKWILGLRVPGCGVRVARCGGARLIVNQLTRLVGCSYGQFILCVLSPFGEQGLYPL